MVIQYDLEKLNALLKHFHFATGLSAVICGVDGEYIARYPPQKNRFCTLLQQNPSIYQKCLASDKIGKSKCVETKEFYSYTCHAGLTETIVPLYYNDIFIGYIMLEDILLDKGMTDYWPEVKNRCTGSGVDEKELKEAFAQIRIVGGEKLYAATQILVACASYIWITRLLTLQENSLPQQISDYIANNLSEDLSINALCRRFNISRAKLYRISNTFFGTGIKQGILSERISKAKDLLANTSLSVNEIAYEVGIADYNYFIKVFKKYTGITPLHYRKNRRKEKSQRPVSDT